MRSGALQPRLTRAQIKLDGLPAGTVIADGRGHAWQKDRGGYWYRAFDAEHVATWEVTQLIRGEFEVLRLALGETNERESNA